MTALWKKSWRWAKTTGSKRRLLKYVIESYGIRRKGKEGGKREKWGERVQMESREWQLQDDSI